MIGAEHALSDALSRDTALDMQRSFIVQAPAGSGKTGLLTRRFLRALATVEQPEQVLAITFTRKAAAEMRARIVSALQQAVAGHVSDSEHERQLLDDAQRALARSNAAGWQLPDTSSRLQIMTVDAMNQRLVAARPLQAQLSGGDLLNTHEITRLYHQAANALCDWLDSDAPHSEAIATLLQRLDVRTDTWRQQLSRMLHTRDQWLGFVLQARKQSGAALRQQSEAALASVIDTELDRLDALFSASQRALLGQALPEALARMPEKTRKEWMQFDAWPAARSQQLAQWQTLVYFLLIGSSKDTTRAFRKTVNKTNGFPTDHPDRRDFNALLSQLADNDALAAALAAVDRLPPPRYSDAQWAAIESLLLLLPTLAAELQRLQAELGKMDYPALAQAAISALDTDRDGRPTDLALQMDYSLSHLLIDEMQDTSTAQYSLLETLTAGWSEGDDRTLFCVGDPMQSVYRFRGANVGRFLQAWQEGIGDVALEPITLETNFRSHRDIVDWVNVTFARIFGDNSDATTDTIRYSPSTTPSSALQNATIAWHLRIDDKSASTDDVIRTLQKIQRECPDESIAILCRSRGAVADVIESLNQQRIACESVALDRLGDLPEMIEPKILTRTLWHEADDIAWLALLRSPLVGLSLAQIDAIMLARQTYDGESEADAMPTIAQWLRRDDVAALLPSREAQALAHVLDQFAHIRRQAAYLPFDQQVYQLWHALGVASLLNDAHELDNVHRYFDLLSELIEAGDLTHANQIDALIDDYKADRPAEQNAPVAMTIHAAKGLEFDHVLLPGLNTQGQRNDNKPPMLTEFLSTGRQQTLLFAAQAERHVEEKDPLFEWLWQRDALRDDNELKRLLYVACTRARKGLHLFANLESKKNGDMKLPRSGSLMRILDPIMPRDQIRQPVQSTDGTLPQACQYEPIRRWLTAPVTPPTDPVKFNAAEHIKTDNNAVTFDWAGSNARHIGTVVHRWLYELACDNRRPSHAQLYSRSCDALTQLGVDSAMVDVAATRVVTAIERVLASEDAVWLLNNDREDSAAELAITMRIDGEVTRRVIDRLVRDQHGTLWVIDYKTSVHEGAGLEAFFANEARRYKDQLDGYREAVTAWLEGQGSVVGALKTALYFPHYARLVVLKDD
ncbi:MAG: UvrD-helicase domain-containing protein [Pseudomonadota bacterium]